MKKRGVVLLVIVGFILVVAVSIFFAMQTDENKADYWEVRLEGTWSVENEDGSVLSITFDGDSITFSDNGTERMRGTFTANDDVIKMYSDGTLYEIPFKRGMNRLSIQMGDTADDILYLEKN
jgi:hypothetical protein